MNALDDRARRALAHGDLAWLRDVVPARFHDQPTIMAKMLDAALGADPTLANSRPFEAAASAVGAWAAGIDLGNRLASAYHDPAIRERMTRSPEEYWADPEGARRKLIALSLADPRLFAKVPQLDRALDALAELNTFGEEHGVEVPASTPVERPIDPAHLDAEIQNLLGRDKLTAAEDARLTRLFEARGAREAEADRAAEAEEDARFDRLYDALGRGDEAEIERAQGIDDEYKTLVNKDKLTPAEDLRLTQLVETRLAEENPEGFDG